MILETQDYSVRVNTFILSSKLLTFMHHRIKYFSLDNNHEIILSNPPCKKLTGTYIRIPHLMILQFSSSYIRSIIKCLNQNNIVLQINKNLVAGGNIKYDFSNKNAIKRLRSPG